MDQVEAILQKCLLSLQKLPNNASLYLAVSGGVDSICLLQLCAILQAQKYLNHIHEISVLHVNHKLRPESKEEAIFVENLARQNQWKFHFIELEWKESEKKSQANFRAKREAAFTKIVGPQGYIAYAHHLDDQAETIFQRILRGSGPLGFTGMQELVGQKIRPLLTIRRQDIMEWMQKHEFEWREDTSNQESYYERNWLRNEIFPLLEARRPGFQSRLVDLAEDVKQLLETKMLQPKAFLISGYELYDCDSLRLLNDHERASFFQCERKHIPMIDQVLNTSSGKLDLPEHSIWNSYGYVLVGKNLNDAIEKLSGNLVEKDQNDCKRIWKSILGEWSVLSDHASIAARKSGDGLKIKKKLMEARVPAFLRSAIPVYNEEVLIPEKFTQEFSWENYKVLYQPSELASQLF